MNHQKKTLCIAGSMLLPIKVGEPAMIREHDGGYRRTDVYKRQSQAHPRRLREQPQGLQAHYSRRCV